MAAEKHEIASSEFKTHCLRLLDEVAENRAPLVITKRGRPIAKLVPIETSADKKPLYGYMKGTILSHGDLISPIDVEWEADADDGSDAHTA